MKTTKSKPTKEDMLRHRVLVKIMDSFGGCFLDNTGQFLRACRLGDEGFVKQMAKSRSVKVDAQGSRYETFGQWFTITQKGKAEVMRLEALGCSK